MQQHTHETKTRTHSTNQHTHARTRPTHARDPEIPAAPSSLATNPSSPSRSRDPAAISLSILASCSTAAPPAAHLCACTSLSPSSRSAPLPWHRRLALDLRPPSLASLPAADAGASSSFRRRQERLVLDHTTSCRRPRPRPLVVPRISALNHRPSLALSVSTRRRELLRSVDRPSFVSGSSSSPRNPFCPVSASAPASANLSHVPDLTRELLRHRQRPSPRRAALDHRHRLPEGLQDPPQALHRPLRPRFRRPDPRCRRTLCTRVGFQVSTRSGWTATNKWTS